MKLDLSKNIDIKKAETYLAKLIDQKAKIEINKFTPQRSGRQNRYFHVVCGILAEYSGYTVNEVKIIIKDQLEFMTYTKNGHRFYVSTADLDTEKFTLLVDFTRSFGDSHGCYLMTPEEFYENQFDIEREFQAIL